MQQNRRFVEATNNQTKMSQKEYIIKYNENLVSIYSLLIMLILLANSINVSVTVCGCFDLEAGSATW